VRVNELVRTLVISDLHIGQPGGVSVLTLQQPLELLLETIRLCDRLVLLGDVIELQESHGSDSFPVAEPILRAIGGALRPEAEVVLVPGNHDHGLIGAWSRGQGKGLEREAIVPHDASPLLEQVIGWLGADRVQVRYPGVWLTEEIWATHGHYLNHYLRPVSTFGVLHPRHRQTAPDPRLPADYEYTAGSPVPHMRDGLPPQRWHDHHLIPTRLAPLIARLLSRQVRNHSLPALAHSVQALGVAAPWVIFGHVHRLGPMPGDAVAPWTGLTGGQRLLNTGSWRFEPVIGHRVHPPHPYWPGGSVVIDDDGVPRAVGLLDGLSEADFR
jgi:UDP-2,3-diacylglucosamine pyrophosphatase LpxH